MSIPDADATMEEAAIEQEVTRLLKRLARLKGDWPSEPALRHLSPQMTEALRKRIEKQSYFNARLRIITGTLLLLFEVSVHNKGGLNGALVTGILIGIILWTALESSKWYALYALTLTWDIRLLPMFIRATNDSKGCHPQVIGAICRLLPHVTEEQAGLLSQQDQARLWYLAIAPARLGPEYDEALVSSVLQAFASVGSRETLERMRQFTREASPYPTHRHVNALMKQIMPGMEARLQRQEVPATLLRASGARDASPQTLLRAARASPSEPAEQLLRAQTSDSSEARK